jgi:cysteine synthase A
VKIMKRESMLELIGNTPMVAYRHNDQVLWLKLEMFNPTGSVKVRPAFFMLKEAKEQGLLHHQSHIVEATSGNMGIALAFVAAQFGYKFTAVMPETMSEERRALIRAYGANIVLTAGSEGMKGAIQEAERMGKEDVNILFLINSIMERMLTPIIRPLDQRFTAIAKEKWRLLLLESGVVVQSPALVAT